MKAPAFPIILCSLSAALLLGCSQEPASPPPPTGGGANSASAPAPPPPGYLGTVANAPSKALKVLDVATLNQAIQMFRVQEDRYPTNLEELTVSGLINRMPEVPRGMKLQYDAASGQVAMVSE